MGRVRAGMQSSGSTTQLRRNEISPLVRRALGLAWSGVGVLAGCRRTPPESVAQMNGTDQTIGRSGEACHLSATAPRLVPSGSRCSRSGASISFATPPLLMQRLVCCIDRLNPQPSAACRQDQRLLFDVDRKGHVASLLTERPLDRRTIRDSESERSHSRLVI